MPTAANHARSSYITRKDSKGTFSHKVKTQEVGRCCHFRVNGYQHCVLARGREFNRKIISTDAANLREPVEYHAVLENVAAEREHVLCSFDQPQINNKKTFLAQQLCKRNRTLLAYPESKVAQPLSPKSKREYKKFIIFAFRMRLLKY